MTLTATLETERLREAVAFRLTVRNEGEESRTVRFPDACRVDIVAKRDGREEWRWSDGRLFARAPVKAEFAPGDATTYRRTWDDPPEGTFDIVGEVRIVDDPLAVKDTVTV